MTKQQTALAIVVGLGLTAVAVDRLVLNSGAAGPSNVNASSALSPSPTVGAPLQPAALDATATPGKDESDQAVLAGHAELASRLEAFAQDRGLGVGAIGEAFAPAGPWAEDRPPDKLPDKPREFVFEKIYKLEAVMTAGDGTGIAVINGKALRPGARLSGYELIEVSPTRALFRLGDLSVELKLAQDR